MQTILIKKGRLIDPGRDVDDIVDIRVGGGIVREIADEIKAKKGEHVIDAAGMIVTPGLIDMHCHLREPGREDEETIESGTRTAVSGGFTAVAAMPNTQPVTDNQAAVGFIIKQASNAGYARVYPVGAVTIGLEGEQMTEIGDLVNAGAVAVTDDGKPIHNSLVMRRVLEYSRIFDIPVIDHCEDLSLSGEGVINEGIVATRLGLPGVPRIAEDIITIRDISIAEYTKGKLHVAHVSTARSAELIRKGKEKGVKLTAEVTPHHLILTDEAVLDYDTNSKVNPPLRLREDVEALREALADGTIDCIATDHAPHHYDEKEKEFSYAPFGMIGLDTALGLVITELVHTGVLDWKQMVQRMSSNPSRILNVPGGTLDIGSSADITVIDPEMEWEVDSNCFYSKSRNSPFEGWKLKGRAVLTMVEGKVVWDIDEIDKKG
jgi:dihydroorotase